MKRDIYMTLVKHPINTFPYFQKRKNVIHVITRQLFFNVLPKIIEQPVS